MTNSLLETLPNECFNHVCVHLALSDLPNLSVCSKSTAALLGGGDDGGPNGSSGNDELWNLLLCQRLWTVDPSKVLADALGDEESHVDKDNTKNDNESRSDTAKPAIVAVNWKKHFRALRQAEQAHQVYLDDLKRLDLHGWLERHFIGQLAPHWNGWENRYWTWDSARSSFSAWEGERRANCFASFPVGRNSEVRRVSEEEQVAFHKQNSHTPTALNPVRTPKPYVFTITNTTFPLLWACGDEEQLQLWLDKISVTLHPLKFGGRLYKAPAKYLIQKKKRKHELKTPY